MNHTMLRGHLPNEAATLKLAQAFAQALRTGGVCFLQGHLGAGKTTFARGVLHALGVVGKIKSPTYTLVTSYQVEPDSNQVRWAGQVHHFDLYRFADPEEWEDAGFREYFSPEALCLIEWPECAITLLPKADIILNLALTDNGRDYALSAATLNGQTCLNRLSTLCAVNS